MQYGQPWLPAEVRIVAVSYFAGPHVSLGPPASGPTHPAVSQLFTLSQASRAMLRTPITQISGRVLPPPSSLPVNRLPLGIVYVPSASGWIRMILPLRSLVLPAVRRASWNEVPL